MLKQKVLMLCVVLFLILSFPAAQLLYSQTYTISGQVITTSEVGLDGVTLTFFDGVTSQTEVTAGGGYYSHTVAAGWRGTVTPSLSGYLFTPAVRNVGPVEMDTIAEFMAWIPVSITGNIEDSVGNPLTLVLLSLSTGESFYTDGYGNYTVLVESGWSGTITPSKVNYAFAPPSTAYTNVTTDQTGQDYVGTYTEAFYFITGTITDGSNPLPGVAVTLSTGGATTTNASGDYTFVVNHGWSGTITPVLSGYTFSPPAISLTNVTANQSNQDFTATASPTQYTVSGTVYGPGRVGLDGVTITATGLSPVVTAGGGHYSLTVPLAWSGTLTPSLAGATFSPSSRFVGPVTADVTDQDFTQVLPTYTISGNVSFSGSGLPGVTLALSTGSGVTTDADGNYSVTVNEGWTGTITPSLSGYTFDPVNRTYTNVSANQTNQDYTASTFTGYVISGTVIDRQGEAGDVVMNGLPGNPVTDAYGNYSAQVPAGWSGTVTPTKSGFLFSPTQRSYANVQADQTAQNYQMYRILTISGTVRAGDSSGLSGVSITYSGTLSGTATTDANGDYTITLNSGWTGSVTPKLTGYTFTPSVRYYNDLTADQTNQDFKALLGLLIGGSITTKNNVPLQGVILSLSDGSSTYTNIEGKYSVTVNEGWTGTVTPSMADWTFEPESRSYSRLSQSQTGQDYIGKTMGKQIVPTYQPLIYVSRTFLNFGTVSGDIVTGPQSFWIGNAGTGDLNWTIAADQDWIDCSPQTGVNSGEVQVSVSPSGLTPGIYSGYITVSAPDAANSPQQVAITLQVYGSSEPPFGELTTPVDGSTVSGVIPVTGWALDDLGVDSVKVYVEKLGFVVELGEAAFMKGARPDIEQLYPDFPRADEAGWGYMLVTNLLPSGGNGTFHLLAKAMDMEGNEVTLGSRTIVCDNANAVKPFGSIDTPAMGETISGTEYLNRGWVLTPQPNAIPADGSTIDIYVDGIKLDKHPDYNIYRQDIATLLPDFANSNGAEGHFYFDTTAYGNGIHTIHWVATDDAGNSDGIGSRYFSIQNSNVDGSSRSLPLRYNQARNLSIKSAIPVRVKKGHGNYTAIQPVFLDGQNSTIRIHELDPLTLEFPQAFSILGGTMQVGENFRALPLGSTLDIRNRRFSWLPLPGFTGEYLLCFVFGNPEGGMGRTTIRIHIVPKYPSLGQ